MTTMSVVQSRREGGGTREEEEQGQEGVRRLHNAALSVDEMGVVGEERPEG